MTCIKFAHKLWTDVIAAGDIAIDATCGNGHDSLFLAKNFALKTLYCIDLQEVAIEKTKSLLAVDSLSNNVKFFCGCHSEFPLEIEQESVSLITYNLGYLPGGDKSKTTQSMTTLLSIKNAMKLVRKGGMISIMCYPGHDEGALEESLLLEFAKHLDKKSWLASHHQWINRDKSPSLLLLNRL